METDTPIKFNKACELHFPLGTGMPTLHFLIQVQAGETIGLCLDFGHYAHSDRDNAEEGSADVICKLVESAYQYILGLKERGLLENLYSNRIVDTSLWETFHTMNIPNQIKAIENLWEGKLISDVTLNFPPLHPQASHHTIGDWLGALYVSLVE